MNSESLYILTESNILHTLIIANFSLHNLHHTYNKTYRTVVIFLKRMHQLDTGRNRRLGLETIEM